MAFDIDAALVDDEIEAEGARYYLDDEAYILVRSANYRPFRVAHHKGIFGGGRLNSEKQIAAAARYQVEKMPALIAKHLVCGWHGLTSGGKPLSYSEELALKIVPRWSFLADILEFASEKANYTRQEKEEVGNESRLASVS